MMRGLTVLAGVLLLAAPATGLWVDVGNNWGYGLTVSHEAAIVLAAAAVGVAGFPALAGIRGWNGLLAAGWVVCLVLTVGAAFLAYTGKQGETADQRKASAEAYQSAKQDEAAARAEERVARDEAAAIGETGAMDELQALADRAQKAADEQAAAAKIAGQLCSAVKRCRDADTALTLATKRLSDAKAKAAALDRAETARTRVETAQEKAKAGPASSPLSAAWIAARAGWQADEVAASIDVGLAVLIIAVTQLFAVMAHPAVALIVVGLERPAPSPAAASPVPVHQMAILPATEQAAMLEQASSPERERPKAAPRKRATRTAPAADIAKVQTWAETALLARSGAALAAGDAFAAFQGETGEKLSQTAFGAAMAAAGFRKEKVGKLGGKVVYTNVAFRQALRLAMGG